MLQRFASNMTELLLKKEIVKAEDREIYVYGFEALLSTALNTLIILAIGGSLGILVETLIYLVAFAILRVYCGGYHAKTHIGCMVFSVLVYGCVMALVTYLPLLLINTGIISLMIGGVSFIVIFKYAPVEHVNRPLTEGEYRFFRRMSRVIATIQIGCIGAMVLIHGLEKTALIISLAMLSVTFILALAKIIERKR